MKTYDELISEAISLGVTHSCSKGDIGCLEKAIKMHKELNKRNQAQDNTNYIKNLLKKEKDIRTLG